MHTNIQIFYVANPRIKYILLKIVDIIYVYCPYSQSGHLDVVVPPDILNAPELSPDESVTNEGGSVQLICQATGVPEPRFDNLII